MRPLQAEASLPEMVEWAENLIAAREPDFIIGDNYLRRWWVIPRNPLMNVYLHEINHSDDDRALHDHPWVNTSILLRGDYIEHTPKGAIHRVAGEIVNREAGAAHRLEVEDNAKVLSLFITGAIVREWGFHCPNGWKHWKDYVASHPGQVGRGCGEQ